MSEADVTRTIVRADYLLAVCPFVGTELQRRPALLGVNIIPYPGGPGCVLIASNGSQLAIIYDESASIVGASAVWRIPLKQLQAAVNKLPARTLNRSTIWIDLAWRFDQRLVRLVAADSSSGVLDGRGAELFRLGVEDLLIDADYPAVWRLIASATPGGDPPASWYKPAFLCRVEKFATDLAGLRDVAPVFICVRTTPSQDVVRVTFEGHPEALVLITMPPHKGEVPSGNPTWLARLA